MVPSAKIVIRFDTAQRGSSRLGATPHSGGVPLAAMSPATAGPNVCYGSNATHSRCRRDVRLAPETGRIDASAAKVETGRYGAGRIHPRLGLVLSALETKLKDLWRNIYGCASCSSWLLYSADFGWLIALALTANTSSRSGRKPTASFFYLISKWTK